MPESHGQDPRPDEGIFPTFFMAGFECSTFIWKDGQRKDYVTLTGHDRQLQEDYRRLMDLGIGVAREAIRWPLVDRGGSRYDWSTLDPVLDALESCQVTPIWDLCHYGFPDGCDPFSEECLRRFADYCAAAAEYVVRRTRPPRFFTPVNEITFLSAGASDMGWIYPFAKGRYAELKRALCRMAIEGVKAIRRVDPEARMVHVDPIIHEVPPQDHPELADEAYHNAYQEAYEAWDILFGHRSPELGGAPEILDIVGVNSYFFSQAETALGGGRKILGPRDPRRKPLGELLMYAWERYHRPIIIGETSGYQDQRAAWLRMVMQESMKALISGADLQGVCLFPCVDIPDWNTGEWAKIGMFDLTDREKLERCPCEPYLEELRRWQKLLDRPEQIEADAVRPGTLSRPGAGFPARSSGRVQLSEVRQCARKLAERDPAIHPVKNTVKMAP